jgi:HlyD family secretion protein
VSEARARLVAARAAVRDARVAAEEAKQNLARTESLVKEGLSPSQELVTRSATERRAAAGIDSAAAQVELAQATLASTETDLEWATVRAPISGVILSRTAEPGQVVAASFQPPVLFVIAEDLKRMDLHVDIDEADVGRVRAGQPATFTVDAYAARTFAAKVESVRNSPRTVQNVVTYEGILSVDNHDEGLKPGMTANVVITTERARGALLVPNAALRFTPPPTQETPEQRREQRVWLLDGERVKRVVVHPGQSDGQRTLLRSGDLPPGTAVLTDVKTNAATRP